MNRQQKTDGFNSTLVTEFNFLLQKLSWRLYLENNLFWFDKTFNNLFLRLIFSMLQDKCKIRSSLFHYNWDFSYQKIFDIQVEQLVLTNFSCSLFGCFFLLWEFQFNKQNILREDSFVDLQIKHIYDDPDLEKGWCDVTWHHQVDSLIWSNILFIRRNFRKTNKGSCS